MVNEKPSSSSRSGTGPAQERGATRPLGRGSGDELERLRDILIGNHIRASDQRIDDVQEQLIDFQRQLDSRLKELAAAFDCQMRDEQKDSRRRDEVLRHELQAFKTFLDEERNSRTELGKLLVEIGERLQQQ